MTSSPQRNPGVRRVAELVLRAPAGPLRARAYWPAAGGTPALLVFFPAGEVDEADALCREVCGEEGVVVLCVPCPPGPVARVGRAAVAATEWAADHAAELDADAGRLAVAGVGRGDELAAVVSWHAREQGWPPVTRRSPPGRR